MTSVLEGRGDNLLSGRGTLATLLRPAGPRNGWHQIDTMPLRTRRQISLAPVSSTYFSNELSCHLTSRYAYVLLCGRIGALALLDLGYTGRSPGGPDWQPAKGDTFTAKSRATLYIGGSATFCRRHLVDTVITVSAGRGRLDRVEHPDEIRVLKRMLAHERTHRRRHREDELRPVVPVGSDVGFRIHRSQQRNIFALE